MNVSNKKAVVVLVRGLPGSGKSYIVSKFLESFKSADVISLDPDMVDKESEAYKQHVIEQEKEGVAPELHLYRFLRAQAYSGIRAGELVIWNQPFSNSEIFKKMTDNFYIQAREVGVELQILVVEVGLDPEAARARVKSRIERGGFGPDDPVFDRFVSEYRSVASEGYDVLPVDGSDAEDAVSKISSKISELISS